MGGEEGAAGGGVGGTRSPLLSAARAVEEDATDAILKAAEYLRDKDLSKMTEEECQQLKADLDHITHPR